MHDEYPGARKSRGRDGGCFANEFPPVGSGREGTCKKVVKDGSSDSSGRPRERLECSESAGGKIKHNNPARRSLCFHSHRRHMFQKSRTALPLFVLGGRRWDRVVYLIAV